MLLAFKRVIKDYVTPPSKELARDLESIIDSYVKFLAKCRPLSISMSNAVKYLKLTFSRIPAGTDDVNAKTELCESIDNFIYDEIICAQRGIAELAITKVNSDSDVILTFGCSLIVKHVLYNAAKKGKKFRVVVVDSRPRFDGREMLRYLLQHNIPATYILINAVSYVMKEVLNVFQLGFD
jgi:translation initiation factor eIF-2B subunit delta